MVVDNKSLWSRFVLGKLGALVREGPDIRQTRYTPSVPLHQEHYCIPGVLQCGAAQ